MYEDDTEDQDLNDPIENDSQDNTEEELEQEEVDGDDAGEEKEGNEQEQENEGDDTGEQEDIAEPQDPKRFAKRINDKHREMMTEKTARLAAEKELEQFKKELGTDVPPIVPELPDPYDENFDELMRKRDEAIVKAVRFDANQKSKVNAERAVEEAKAAERTAELNSRIDNYARRAEKLQISKNELKVAGAAVEAMGIQPDLAEFIIDAEQGPLITKHLASNPDELDKLNGMRPMAAAIYISNTILPKVSKAPKKRIAPKPADTLSGGKTPSSNDGPPGATYE